MSLYKDIGFSLWVDFIERGFLDTEFKQLIADGFVNGATSNPAIFRQAILSFGSYAVQKENREKLPPKALYEQIAIADIKKAARALRPLYEGGNDGFVSIEIDPFLANDTKKSIEEGMRLWESIDEPNIMIKVPATACGYVVMEELLGREINVNATLVFSDRQAQAICDAVKKAGSVRAKAVISVFVSRFDRKLEGKLAGTPYANRVGIMNAAGIYNLVERNKLPRTRTLFASTGVKGDGLSADYYIRQLLAPNSVNTAPLETIAAFGRESRALPRLPIAQSEIDTFFDGLKTTGVDMPIVCDELMSEGVAQFEDAFAQILQALEG